MVGSLGKPGFLLKPQISLCVSVRKRGVATGCNEELQGKDRNGPLVEHKESIQRQNVHYLMLRCFCFRYMHRSR